MVLNWISPKVGDAFVERKQYPIGSEGGIDNCIDNCPVRSTAKAFVGDRVGIVAQAAKVRHQFNGEVLVELEVHIARIGTRRSSCANSAA